MTSPEIITTVNWIIIVSTIISGILCTYASTLFIKEINKLSKAKTIAYTYRIGQRPDLFDIKKFKHPYITVEKRGVIIFVYSTGKKYKDSIFKTESIFDLLNKVENQ